MRDAYAGERQVKSKGQLYLPATQGQILDGMNKATDIGSLAYAAYVKRARFPNFVREAVQTAVGMLHSKPPKISLPEKLKDVRSSRGETLPQLLRRINAEQLITGRIGILADVPNGVTNAIPYLATYSAERIINWDDGSMSTVNPQELELIVIDESEFVRADSLQWVETTKYRVLMKNNAGKYVFGVFETADFEASKLKAASIAGKNPETIPFVMVNACDLVTDTDEPPLMDLGNLCMTIYRAEADYRQNLFMQGQDTLVVIGSIADDEEAIRTGAGSNIQVPMGGDAKYIGVNSDGLSEQRESLENDRMRAGSMGAQSIDTVSRQRESGTSLNIRIAARTADLTQIAMTAAAGLERILKICAKWVGANPEEVVIEPNLEFGDMPLTGQNMVEMQTAQNLGYPVSSKSLHRLAFDRGVTKLSFEEEMAERKKEKGSVFDIGINGDRAPEQSMGGKPLEGKDNAN